MAVSSARMGGGFLEALLIFVLALAAWSAFFWSVALQLIFLPSWSCFERSEAWLVNLIGVSGWAALALAFAFPARRIHPRGIVYLLAFLAVPLDVVFLYWLLRLLGFNFGGLVL